MKKIILNLALFLFPIMIYGQYAYEDGIIITKTSDTIICFVPLEIAYRDEIKIKLNNGSDDQIIKSKDIMYLATPYNIFENITFTKNKKQKEKLIRFVIDGHICLYINTITNHNLSLIESDETFSYINNTPKLEYIVKKNNEAYFINRKNFTEIIVPLIQDNKDLVQKIEKKKLKYKNLEQIINKYNTDSQ